MPGSWERTIGTHHSIVSLVMEARAWLPDAIGGTLWFAPHAAHTSTQALNLPSHFFGRMGRWCLHCVCLVAPTPGAGGRGRRDELHRIKRTTRA